MGSSLCAACGCPSPLTEGRKAGSSERACAGPVVGEAQLVAAAARIDDPVLVEVEEVGVVVAVVRLPPPVGLLLIHQLPGVLAQQVALVRLLL